MALQIQGKKYTPTAAAKKIVALALPNGAASLGYLDAGVRVGRTEESKLDAALAKTVARVKKLLGNP